MMNIYIYFFSMIMIYTRHWYWIIRKLKKKNKIKNKIQKQDSTFRDDQTLLWMLHKTNRFFLSCLIIG